jgi:hypothetical protein
MHPENYRSVFDEFILISFIQILKSRANIEILGDLQPLYRGFI